MIGTLNANGKAAGSATQQDAESGMLVTARAVSTHGGQRFDPSQETLIAHALSAEGFDASEDGTGRGTPLIPVAGTIQASDGGMSIDRVGELVPVPILEVGKGTTSRGSGPNGCGIGKAGDPMFTLQANAQHAVAFNWQAGGSKAMVGGTNPYSDALQSSQIPAVSNAMGVRRLTPLECERLQGFPDYYTLIKFRGKPAADGPRYRALGNSMATVAMYWLGQRIAMVDALNVSIPATRPAQGEA